MSISNRSADTDLRAWSNFSGSGGSSGGSALPSVTAADNGAVLTVVDGKWGKASFGGSGATGMVVSIARNSTDTNNYTMMTDKTYNEIIGCLENGITPVFSVTETVDGTEMTFLLTLMGYAVVNGVYTLSLASTIGDGSTNLSADDPDSVLTCVVGTGGSNAQELPEGGSK